MVKTEVYNATNQDFTLKEGNAGVYRDITVVKPTKRHVIELDPNATYREYVVVYTGSGEKEFITSDDCLDNSKITIQRGADDKFKFENVSRTSESTSKPPAGGGFFSGIMKKFGGK